MGPFWGLQMARTDTRYLLHGGMSLVFTGCMILGQNTTPKMGRNGVDSGDDGMKMTMDPRADPRGEMCWIG